MAQSIISQLFDTLMERRSADFSQSYTAKLLQGGVEKINAKVLEEAQEVVEASHEEGLEHLKYEICDLTPTRALKTQPQNVKSFTPAMLYIFLQFYILLMKIWYVRPGV